MSQPVTQSASNMEIPWCGTRESVTKLSGIRNQLCSVASHAIPYNRFFPPLHRIFPFELPGSNWGLAGGTGYSTGLLHLREDSGHHCQVFFLQRDGYRTVLRGTPAN